MFPLVRVLDVLLPVVVFEVVFVDLFFSVEVVVPDWPLKQFPMVGVSGVFCVLFCAWFLCSCVTVILQEEKLLLS